MSSRTDNMADVIDSRDVIERIEELENDVFYAEENGDEPDATDVANLAALKALAAEGESLDDWTHGVTLVRESYFTDYCEELCEEIGDMPKDLPSYIVIDWAATARNLRADYTEVEYDGITYLAR